MQKDRMLAFSDGVMAVIITIMVLELKAPHGVSFRDLKPVCLGFATYVLSFVYVGIYWNNHHHMLSTTEKTNGLVLWANLHLLFWLSLVPFATAWLGASKMAGDPAATYAFVMLMCGVSYTLLQASIIRMQGPASELKQAVGRDLKGKVSLICYAAAIAVSRLLPWLCASIAALPAVLWFIPDRRIESRLEP